MTYTLEMTADERQVLVNLLDAAVKALGLQAAEAALTLVKKIAEKPAEEAGA